MKTSEDIKPGDKITISGFSKDSRGRLLNNGISVHTKRKCKPVTPYVFVMMKEA